MLTIVLTAMLVALVVEAGVATYHEKEKQQAKVRLEYLLTEHSLPKEIKERQKIYREIGVLLEKVQ